MKHTKQIDVLGRKAWKYVPASQTDVAATIKAAQRRIEEQRKAEEESRVAKVRKIK